MNIVQIMDENDTRQKQNKEGPESAEDRKDNDKDESEFNNQHQRVTESNSNHRFKQNRGSSKTRSTPTKNQRLLSHSRSRSRSCSRASGNTFSSKHWVSSNAFVNFVQDFRQDFVGTRSTRIFQLAGERWRQMSPEEKQPYIEAARTVKQQRQERKTPEQANKTNGKTDKKIQDNWKKKDKQGNNQQKQNSKSGSNADSDSDSATSGTAGSVTSEDVSDLSS